MKCRGCGSTATDLVLDLGLVPAADFFPLASTPVSTNECSHPLAMELCRDCGLAQLAEDDTTTQEPRGVEPQALKDQAAEAVRILDGAGWLQGDTVIEFGSPHGGSWLPLLTESGLSEPTDHAPASVVLDSFGIMHESDQHLAFRERARSTADGGVLLLQFHSLQTIIRRGQWNALRHGHFAYYSLSSMTRLLADVGMTVAEAWEFPVYGGTVLVAARHGAAPANSVSVARIGQEEKTFGVANPLTIRRLQSSADTQVAALRGWLETMADDHRRVFAYGAASRAVALFSRAELDRRLIGAVADASDAKQNRRMPGTDIPIISPEQLLAANPDRVLLTVPDLLPEVTRRYPALEERWVRADLTNVHPHKEESSEMAPVTPGYRR